MYRLHTPEPALQPYIEHYWFVAHSVDDPVDIRVDVYVDARADLVFNFEAPYRREVIGGETIELAASNLDAQRLVPIRIHQRGQVRIAGVRFRLGGLAPFATGPLAVWSGRTPAPEEVFGDDAVRLERELRAESDVAAQAAMLDAFFLARRTGGEAQRTFERALAVLVDRDGLAPVTELAAEVSASMRHVERLFAAKLGFSPRTVGRVLRFQHALRRLMSDPGISLGELASVTGYYDQAHFVREFRVLSGGVPRGYRGYFPPQGPFDFAPNVVAFVQDGEAAAP